MITVCCVCQRIKHENQWVEENIPSGELPTHGYCPECAAMARIELFLLRLRDLVEKDSREKRSVA